MPECSMCPAFLTSEESLACGKCAGCRSAPAQTVLTASTGTPAPEPVDPVQKAVAAERQRCIDWVNSCRDVRVAVDGPVSAELERWAAETAECVVNAATARIEHGIGEGESNDLR